MAECRFCGREKTPGLSCTVSTYALVDPAPGMMNTYSRVRFTSKHLAACRECGSPIDGFHHAECSQEQCPKCGKRRTTCYCNLRHIPNGGED